MKNTSPSHELESRSTRRKAQLYGVAVVLLLAAIPAGWWALSNAIQPPQRVAAALVDRGQTELAPAGSIAEGSVAEDDGARTPLEVELTIDGLDEIEDDAPEPPRVFGRVEDTSGRPLAGVRAELRERASYDQCLSELDDPDFSTVTDDRGFFELRPGPRDTRQLTLSSDAHEPFRTSIAYINAPRDLGVVVLRDASRLHGIVVDEQGNGVEGARILSVDPVGQPSEEGGKSRPEEVLATSDADGHFVARGPALLAGGTQWSLIAEHPRFAIGAAAGRLESGAVSEVRDIRIELVEGATIVGRVVGLTPVFMADCPTISVSVSNLTLLSLDDDTIWDTGEWRLPIDADGNFEVSGVTSSEGHAFSVWTEDRISAGSRRRSPFVFLSVPLLDPTTQTIATALPSEIELRVQTPAKLRVTVTDAAGQPIPGLVAESYEGDVVSPDRRRGYGGDPMPEGTLDVEVEAFYLETAVELGVSLDAPGFKQWKSDSVAVAPGEIRSLGTIVLEPGEDEAVSTEVDPSKRSVTVEVVDVDGRPIPFAGCGYRVVAQGQNRTEWHWMGRLGTGTVQLKRDSAYEFRYYNLDREFSNRDSGLWARDAVWTPIAAGDAVGPVRVVAPPLASVEATLTLAGLPLAGASLKLDPREEDSGQYSVWDTLRPDSASPRTDGMGRVTVAGLLPGPWRAWVFHPGLRMGQSFEIDLQPGVNAVTLDRASSRIEGRVVDAQGRGIAGIAVHAVPTGSGGLLTFHRQDPLHSPSGLRSGHGATGTRDMTATSTDGSGRYRLDGVSVGVPVAAAVATRGYVFKETHPVTLQSGDAVVLDDLILGPAGALQIVLPYGHSGDAYMTEVVDDGTIPATEPIDIWGSVHQTRTIDSLPPGRWNVNVEWGVIGEIERTGDVVVEVEIRPGETTRLDLSGSDR